VPSTITVFSPPAAASAPVLRPECHCREVFRRISG